MTIDINFELATFIQDFIRLVVALLLGSIIGIERQLAGHSAGLRTNILVSVGSAIFTLAGITAAGDNSQDVSRIVQGIAAGVGFLGAGTILKLSDISKVQGLTTASSIWVVAAMGTAAGLGEFALAASTVCIMLITLVILKPLSNKLTSIHLKNKK